MPRGVYDRSKKIREPYREPTSPYEIKIEVEKRPRSKLVYRDIDLHPRHQNLMNHIDKVAALWEK